MKLSATSFLPVLLASSFALVLAAPEAIGQGATAQQSYERQRAACNTGNLPAPEREACVRAAGSALDSARGGSPPSDVQRSTPEGRATLVAPPGARPPATGSDVVTSPDGRAVVVPPSDRSVPR